MKSKFFGNRFLNADAAGQTATTSAAQTAAAKPEVELTSEALTALKAEYTTAWQAMLLLTDPFSKETKDARMAVWTIEGKIKAEENRIKAEILAAEAEEKRNQRLQLNTNQFAAYDALLSLKADKKADPEKVAAAQTAFDTAKELVDNELLAKYAKSAPAKTAVAGEKTGNTDTEAKKAAIIELYLAGKTQKEIEAAGYARSTVWHTINNYKIANNLS